MLHSQHLRLQRWYASYDPVPEQQLIRSKATSTSSTKKDGRRTTKVVIPHGESSESHWRISQGTVARDGNQPSLHFPTRHFCLGSTALCWCFYFFQHLQMFHFLLQMLYFSGYFPSIYKSFTSSPSFVTALQLSMPTAILSISLPLPKNGPTV